MVPQTSIWVGGLFPIDFSPPVCAALHPWPLCSLCTSVSLTPYDPAVYMLSSVQHQLPAHHFGEATLSLAAAGLNIQDLFTHFLTEQLPSALEIE